MAKQLNLQLRRQSGVSAFDIGSPINWLAVHRRARRIAATIARQTYDLSRNGGLRDGFAIRTYAGEAALLERVRALRAGKRVKRTPGDRLRVPPSVLMATTPEGRRLHALIAQLEERVAAREAVTLCG